MILYTLQASVLHPKHYSEVTLVLYCVPGTKVFLFSPQFCDVAEVVIIHQII